MTNIVEEILTAKGIDLGVPEWRVVSSEPVGVERFGKDHYSTLLYIESRAVDNKGLLNHDQMRCDADRHPFLAQATKRSIAFGYPTTKYPSFLARGEHLPDHDDYDCADDLVAAGMVTVAMPVEKGGKFVDANGHVVRSPEGEPFNPKVFTGMDELLLGRSATWGLTEYGFKVASALRAHKADGGNLTTWVLPLGGRMTFEEVYRSYVGSFAAMAEICEDDDFGLSLVAFRDFVSDNDMRSMKSKHHLVDLTGPWGWFISPELSTTECLYLTRGITERTEEFVTVPLRWFTDNAAAREEMLANQAELEAARAAIDADRRADRKAARDEKAAREKAERRVLLADLLTEFADDLPEPLVRP